MKENKIEFASVTLTYKFSYYFKLQTLQDKSHTRQSFPSSSQNIFNFLQYICTQKLSLYNLYLVTMEDRMLVILLLRVDTASSFPSGSCSGMRLHSPSSFNTCCLLLHTRSTVDSTLNQVIIYQLTRKKHNPKLELIETQYSIINILLIFDVSLFP